MCQQDRPKGVTNDEDALHAMWWNTDKGTVIGLIVAAMREGWEFEKEDTK